MSSRSLLLTPIGVSLLCATVGAVPPTIHIIWLESPQPVADQDYVIDDTDPDSPKLELIHESLTWQIWSTDTDNPSNIGDIGEITSPHPQNFAVRIQNGSFGSGARDVTKIDLDPQGTGSDAKYSRIVAATITGNVDGPIFVQKASGGSGGTVASTSVSGNVGGNVTFDTVASGTLAISGNVTGNITAASLSSSSVGGNVTGNPSATSANGFTVGGNVTGSITVTDGGGMTVSGFVDGDVTMTSGDGFTIGGDFGKLSSAARTLTVTNIAAGTLSMNKLMNATVLVTNEIRNAGQLKIKQDVDGLGYVTINKIVSCGAVEKAVVIGDSTSTLGFSCSATIWSKNPLPNGCTMDLSRADETRIFNFANDAGAYQSVDGKILMFKYSGEISGFGSLGGEVTISNDMSAGRLEFSNISATGKINITGKCSQLISLNDLEGDITIGGDLDNSAGGGGTTAIIDIVDDLLAAGSITIGGHVKDQGIEIDGDTLGGSLIQVTGNVETVVNVDGSHAGTLEVDGDLNGDVVVLGSVSSTGAIDIAGALTSTGDIAITGQLDGDIWIGEYTESGSDIDAAGLGSTGSIQVNTLNDDAFNADGDITIGYSSPPTGVTFDGFVIIANGPESGGVFGGVATITGCHATISG